MKTHILLNPAGANGAAGRRWRQVEPLARRTFPNLVLHQSRGPGDLRRVARDLAGESGLVLAAGGDGTSHEVVGGLMAAHPTIRAVMGWLPLGSGNDLARAHGVPRDPAHAITGYANIATGAADVGLVEYGTLNDGRTATIFGNSLTFGVTATVLEQMTRGNTPHRGPLSYFLAALRGFVSHTPLEVAVDGAAGTFRVVSITNGPTFGAGMLVTPMARLDDGALDLLTVSGISRLRTTLLFPRIYWGGHLRHPAVRHRQIRQLTIDAAGPLSFEVDGELMSGFPPFQVSVIAAGLPVAKPVHDHSS